MQFGYRAERDALVRAVEEEFDVVALRGSAAAGRHLAVVRRFQVQGVLLSLVAKDEEAADDVAGSEGRAVAVDAAARVHRGARDVAVREAPAVVARGRLERGLPRRPAHAVVRVGGPVLRDRNLPIPVVRNQSA